MIRRGSKLGQATVGELFTDMRSDYDAAKRTRFKRQRQGIIATGSGSDYHYRTWPEYARIMETARDLFRNHPLIGQGIRRLVANILRGGFTLDVKTGDESLNQELSGRWYEWAEDADACDIQGEQNFHGLEKMALQHVIVDGDCLSLPTVDGSLQQLEGHRLRTPNGTTRNVVHGVLLNERRQRQEYWVTKDDIDPLASLSRVGDVTKYAARAVDDLTGKQHRQVFHHYMPDRITQTRGITALVPVIDTAGMGDDLAFATLVKAQMSACVTIFRELASDQNLPPQVGADGIETTQEQRPNGTTRALAGWQPGMEMFGFPGEKLQGFSPNVPNAEFFTHMTLILSTIAVNLDLPVAVLLLDPSNTNFSGWRGAIDQARQRFQELQCWLIQSLHCPTYTWKVRQWAREDASIRAAVERTVRRKKIGTDGVDAFGHVWHAQEWPYIEPVNDAQGDVIQERNMLISPRRRAARRGMDYQELVGEIMADREMVIMAADATAERINKKKKTGDQLTWKDIAIFGPPEGAQFAQVLPQYQQPSNNPAQGQPKNIAPVNDPLPTNRIAAPLANLEKVNGHAK